jgi:hypothetical protein
VLGQHRLARHDVDVLHALRNRKGVGRRYRKRGASRDQSGDHGER